MTTKAGYLLVRPRRWRLYLVFAECLIRHWLRRPSSDARAEWLAEFAVRNARIL